MSTAQSTARPRTSMLRSVAANWAGLGINALLSLALTPILVHGLGNLYFGMFMLVGSVLDSCWLLDFGMRTALFRFLSFHWGAGEQEEVNRTFSSGLLIACASALMIVLLAAIAAFVAPHFFMVAAADRPIFRALLLLSGATVAAYFLAQSLGTCLYAFRRFDLFNLNSTSTGLLRAVAIVIALRLGGGVRSVAAITLATALLSLALAIFMVRSANHELRFSLRLISKARLRELVGFSGNAFLGTLGDQMRFFVDSLVIGRVLGVAAVTPFVIPSRLMVLFRELGSSLSSPLAGGMNESAGRGDGETLRASFLRATRFCTLLSLFVSLMLGLNGRWLIQFWVGSGFAGSYRLMLILLCGYCLMMAQLPSVDLLLAQARHQWRGWWNLGEGLANLVLSVYLGRRYGLVGIALGTALPMLVVQLLVQPWYALHTVSISPLRYLREALLGPMFAAAAVLAVAALVRPWTHEYSFAWMIFSGAWQAALFALLAWRLGLGVEERRQLLDRAAALRSRLASA